MKRLILIRHCETDYNSEGRYCGHSDPPLNEKGIWQAGRLAESLKGLNIGRAYSSDLKRAVMTARMIFNDRPAEESEDLREINFGAFEGLGYEEIGRRYPKLYKTWLDNPVMVRIPAGETLKGLSKRVMKRLSLILSLQKDGDIAVVTHGGPIRVILCDVLKQGLEAFWRIRQDTGALNIIDYPAGLPPVIAGMNKTTHLGRREAVPL